MITNREVKECNIHDSNRKILVIEKIEVNKYLKITLGKPRNVRLYSI